MKKSYIISIIIVIIALGIVCGIIIWNMNRNDVSELQPKVETQFTSVEQNLENGIQIVSTSNMDVKVSPNAIFIFKTYYKNCKHTTMQRIEVPKALVNKTEEEVQTGYEDWKIDEFNTNQVIFYQEKEGICDEHYIIKENNGYVAVYNIDEYGTETLKETTEIVIDYLPQTDQNLLKEGIKVNGKDELNATIEDYE